MKVLVIGGSVRQAFLRGTSERIPTAPAGRSTTSPGSENQEGHILDPASVAEAFEERTLVFQTAGLATFDSRLKRQQR
jgi:hypothetical protein